MQVCLGVCGTNGVLWRQNTIVTFLHVHTGYRSAKSVCLSFTCELVLGMAVWWIAGEGDESVFTHCSAFSSHKIQLARIEWWKRCTVTTYSIAVDSEVKKGEFACIEMTELLCKIQIEMIFSCHLGLPLPSWNHGVTVFGWALEISAKFTWEKWSITSDTIETRRRPVNYLSWKVSCELAT